MTSKRSVISSALLVLALAAGTTACGGSDDKSAGDNPSSTSGATDGSSSGSSGGKSGGASDGVEFKVGTDVPKDYPTDDVPLVTGKVLSGTKGAFTPSGKQVKGWTIRVKSTKSASATLKSAIQRLHAEGFKDVKNKNYGSNQAEVKDAKYDVQLMAAKVKGGSIVIYSVTFL
jgi:hypothetical protein